MPATLLPSAPIPAPYHGRRAMVAEFFTHARHGHADTVLPPLADGDCATCPRGLLWHRQAGVWTIPGHPEGLAVTDAQIAAWWHRHNYPASRFTLVTHLTPTTLHRVAAAFYADDNANEAITGQQLRHHLARMLHRPSTLSAHLELPAGIVTLHSTRAPHADTVYLPL